MKGQKTGEEKRLRMKAKKNQRRHDVINEKTINMNSMQMKNKMLLFTKREIYFNG